MPATSVPRGSSGSMRALFRSSSAEVVDHVIFSSGDGDGRVPSGSFFVRAKV